MPAHCSVTKNCLFIRLFNRKLGLGKDFDARILAQVEAPVVKAKTSDNGRKIYAFI